MIHAIVALLLTQDVPGLGSPPGALDGGEPFVSANGRCRNCHDRFISAEGDPLYLPYDGWVSTMMANSVRDPLFQAALSVANQDAPGVGSWCLRCHAPQSFIRGHNLPPDGGAFDALDTEGVTCDVCHRAVAAPDSGSPLIGNAQIYFDTSNVKYGPYPGVSSPEHSGSDAGITGSSELCGQCHQVSNPLVAWRNPEDGGVLGDQFPLDTTYDEWKQSQYARPGTLQTCQDCHMPRTLGADGGTMWPVAKFAEGPRESPRRHALVGGNLWGLAAVQKNDPAVAAAYADQFAETTRLTEEALRHAAEVSVTVPETTRPGGVLVVNVKVKNKTGHKLPTGYADGRRIVVQLLLNGSLHSGGFDGGALLDDPWLRVYEVKHGRYGVGAEDHLVQHDLIVSDSRIPPSGFSPPRGAATLPVPATRYLQVDGGYSDTDEVYWDVDVPLDLPNGSTFDITVRLLYQATTPEYVGFLHAENTTTDRGQNLRDIWQQTGEGAPFEMARVEKHIPVRFGGTGGGSGGSGGSGGGSGGSSGGSSGGNNGPPLTGACGCAAAGGAELLALLLLTTRLRRNRAR